jgi:hypothetical protein
MSLPRNNHIAEVVPEAVYWREYYELSDVHYEWNNGYLEEKPVSDFETGDMYLWFLHLLQLYFKTHAIGQISVLDMGFRLALKNKTTIRKPDLGIVLNTNPVEAKAKDRSYHGTFDMCIEALSDSDKGEIERDTVVKKAEYAEAGVKEYFILHDSDSHRAFYRLSARNTYVPIVPQNGVIYSDVLPGFQFRIRDLHEHPDLESMLEDSVYRDFVLPAWRQDREARREAEQRAEVEKLRAEEEKHKAEAEEKRAEAEKSRADAAETEIARLQALLQQQGER